MQLIENIIDTQKENYDIIGSFNALDNVELTLEVTGSSAPWNNPTFELHGLKSDLTKVRQITGISIVDKANKIVKINLLNQMTTCSGILQLQLIIRDVNRTSSTIFCVKVNKSLEVDKTTSTDSIKIYADLEELNKNMTAAEVIRNENEGVRETAEELRQLAETEREEKFTEIETLWNSIKDDEVISEVQRSRTSIFEGEKSSLDERLNTDLSEINRKFDDGQFIEYERQNITANNSLAGYTKDMKIEGATYQNLANLAYSSTWKASGDKITNLYTITPSLKQSTTYTAILSHYPSSNYKKWYLGVSGSENYTDGNIKVFSTTTTGKFDGMTVHLFGGTAEQAQTDVSGYNGTITILEGDYTNKPIPSYFEGIKSVAEDEENKISILSKNKNLLDIAKTFGANEQVYRTTNTGFIQRGSRAYVPLKYSNLKPNTSYTISGKGAGESVKGFRIEVRQDGVKFADSNAVDNEMKIFTTPSVINETLELMIWASKTMTASTNDLDGCGVDNVQLEEGIISTPYEPYKSDKKDILLPNPLRGFSDGVKDTIEFINNKWCYVQRIGENILDGSESWSSSSYSTSITQKQYVYLNNLLRNSRIICDRFPFTNDSQEYKKDMEICFTDGMLNISILKSKLHIPDLAGFKAWLQANPVTVYYELETPVITPFELNPNLISWEGTTHIFSENSISPNINCKVSTNIPALLSDLQTENESLKNDLNENNEKIIDASLYSVENDYRLTLLELGLA